LTSQSSSEDFENLVRAEVEKRMQVWLGQQSQMGDVIFKVKNDFYKMYNYFTRAQQIVTLISATARKASVKEATRRVDWDHVQKEFPVMVESACDSILSLKDTVKHLEPIEKKQVFEETKRKVDINELIDKV